MSAPAQRIEMRVPETPKPAATNILSLKEEKQPRNSVEMATLIAYYLDYIAPENERKNTIGTADLKRYCIQAQYPVPSNDRQVLFKAKSSGYLEQKEHGAYRLTPVGYNLIAHRLPAKATEASTTTRKARSRKLGAKANAGRRK